MNEDQRLILYYVQKKSWWWTEAFVIFFLILLLVRIYERILDKFTDGLNDICSKKYGLYRKQLKVVPSTEVKHHKIVKNYNYMQEQKKIENVNEILFKRVALHRVNGLKERVLGPGISVIFWYFSYLHKNIFYVY